MAAIIDTSKVPTHYTASFDEDGRPHAITPDEGNADDVAGKLPSGWDSTFWDWQPRSDPKGKWVQRVDAKREKVWSQIKAERKAALHDGLKIAQGVIQIEPASLEALRGRALRLSLPSAPETVSWVMADNSICTFTKDEFLSVVAAAEDHVDALHQQSQAARESIFNPANNTLEKLEASVSKGVS